MAITHPKTKDHLAAIVLAAGQSKRMGRFKPLLPFGEKTVIEKVVEYFLVGGVKTVVVVVGHRADELRQQLGRGPIRFALNPDPESEMSESIAYGLGELPRDCAATFITPVDFPAVPAIVISNLIQSWQDGDEKIFVPEHSGRGGHPVLIDLSLREQLLNLDPRRGLRGLFEDHVGEVRHVPVDSAFIARDVDTWDDYCTLHNEVFGTLPPDAV